MEKPVPLLILVALQATFALLSLPTSAETNVLYSGSRLVSSQRLVYKDYFLVLQQDCNLGLYVGDTHHPIWTSNTAYMAYRCYLELQSNGELIVYGMTRRIFRAVWRSNVTSNEGSYVLVVQYDGSIHVYGSTVWSPQAVANATSEVTNIRGRAISSSSIWPSTTDSVLFTNDVAPIGATIVNGAHELRLKDDCNLVLSDTSSGDVKWETGATDKNLLRDCFVNLEFTGELKVKYMGGETLWGSGAVNPGEYVLALSPEGKLAVYGPSIWQAKKSSVIEQVKATADTVAVN